MDKLMVACVQQRMSIPSSQAEFEDQIRRFMRLAQAKAVQVIVFPELSGLMLAPPLFSGLKLGFIRRAHEGNRPGAGGVQRGVKRVAEAAVGALGGFRGSLEGLLHKHADRLRGVYEESFGRLAREFGMVVVGGSLYLPDPATHSLRHRAFVFDADGTILGAQDKLNLIPDEQDLATPGTVVAPIDTQYGRLGLLVGWDVLYPELARALIAQGAELLIGIAAARGGAQAQVLRSALGLRAEENQVFVAASFLIGPNYLSRINRDDYAGQSAILAPISMTDRGTGVLVQVGTNRTESLIATELNYEALHRQWQSSNFRPRHHMILGTAGAVLTELYGQGLTLQQMFDARAIVEPPAPPVPDGEGFTRVEVPPEYVEPETPAEPAPAVPESGVPTGETQSNDQ